MRRRELLGAVGLGLGGIGLGAGLAGATLDSSSADASVGNDDGTSGGVAAQEQVPFHGPHQAGIATAPQTHARFIALDLRAGVDRSALVRLMRLLTDDVERLASGRPALADPVPELAGSPARLTVTVGFGRGLLTAADTLDQAPDWLVDGLPAFGTDRLRPRWSHGDLLMQIGADDPITVAHATRVLLADAASFASVRWSQTGFHGAGQVGPTPPGAPPGTRPTGRNLFGQLDGTVNPIADTEDFSRVVWVPTSEASPSWLHGGTALVLRRIAMDLATWGALDRVTKESSVGRRLADGAPLTGGHEFSAPDYEAVNGRGFPIIPAISHMRLAHPRAPRERILRRPYNYDDGITEDGNPDTGLLFAAYMADPITQFVPIQQRLADADLLNLWTTTIGSALFAIPPGAQPGQYLGQALLGSSARSAP